VAAKQPPGEHPLSDLNLDAWPYALLSFYGDFFFETYIDAEIHSLTRIETPPLAGDFSYDGRVDALDLYGWADTFGSTDVLYADGNAVGVVDGADFLIWQRHVGGGSQTAAGAVVPEPAGGLLLVLGVWQAEVFRRRHGN
jgi:hypothetical protein